jgi:ankyrin repeat protein
MKKKTVKSKKAEQPKVKLIEKPFKGNELDDFFSDNSIVSMPVGKDIIINVEAGFTLPNYETMMKSLNALKSLLQKGIDINSKNDAGATPLIFASAAGDIGLVKELISKGAKLDETNNIGYTALIMAAATGRNNIVEALVKAGANRNIAGKNGKKAIDLCLNEESKKILI